MSSCEWTYKQSLVLVTLYTLHFHSPLTKLEPFFLFSLTSGVTSWFLILLKYKDLPSYCHMWHQDFVEKGPLWSSPSLLKGCRSRSHSSDGISSTSLWPKELVRSLMASLLSHEPTLMRPSDSWALSFYSISGLSCKPVKCRHGKWNRVHL